MDQSEKTYRLSETAVNGPQQGGTCRLTTVADTRSLESNKDITQHDQADNHDPNRLLRISGEEESKIDDEDWQMVEQKEPAKDETETAPAHSWRSHFSIDVGLGRYKTRLFAFDTDIKRYD